jgi:rhodanese-related sulfurtransferase
MRTIPLLLWFVIWGMAALTAQARLAEGVESSPISLSDLKAAIATKKVALIDCNGTEVFARRHIPGAIDLEAHIDRLHRVLPARKDALIVVYCSNKNCYKYEQGVRLAIELGYTNVMHFPPGIRGWVEAGETIAVTDSR